MAIKSSLFLALLCCANIFASSSSSSLNHIYEVCGFDADCAQDKAVKLIDRLDSMPTIALLGDFVTIQRRGKSVAEEPEEDLVARAIRYAANHDLKIGLPQTLRSSRALEAARTSKLKKLIVPALLLLKLKAWIVIPAVLSLIAFVAFNGMGAGMMALAISAVTAIKSLLLAHPPPKQYSVEVVPPIWSRAGSPVAGAMPHSLPGIPTSMVPASSPAATAASSPAGGPNSAAAAAEWAYSAYNTLPQ